MNEVLVLFHRVLWLNVEFSFHNRSYFLVYRRIKLNIEKTKPNKFTDDVDRVRENPKVYFDYNSVDYSRRKNCYSCGL